MFFLGKSAQFTSADIANGNFAVWVNQAYTDYRKVSPCSVQSGQVTQNQITSQIIGGTIQSVVGSIMSQAQSAASTSGGGSDAASKDNKEGDKKKQKNEDKISSNQNNTENNSGGDNNSGNSSNNSSSNGSTASGVSNKNDNKKEEKGEEVAATTTMNVDAQNQNDAKNDNGGGKGGGKNGKSSSNNPIIVSSDLTTAQNLDKTFTPILNLSMSQSSMTGMSSWGLTSMIWFNFKQFALSGKYTKIHFSQNGKLKWVHNLNLTAVYSYGNIIGFVVYSGILNAGKIGRAHV